MSDTITFPHGESLILERIEQEFAERQESDARLAALMGDLYAAFKAATETSRGAIHG